MKRGGGVPADAQSVRLCCESTDAVYGDQVALLYRHALLASLVTIVNAVLLTAVHWSTVPTGILLGWLSAMGVVNALRLRLVRRYHREQPTADQARYWGRRYVLVVTLVGTCWGAVAILLFPVQTLEQRVFTVLVLAGMGAGGVPVLAAVKPAALGYLTTITLPVAAAFAFQGTDLSVVLSLMMLVFLGGMVTTTSIAHRSVIESLRLSLENRRLLDQAMADNARLQTAIERQEQAERASREINETLEARVQARTVELERLANYDPLTRLPNRLLLQERLECALDKAQCNSEQVAVLFLDLDRFKMINDILGHDTGDSVLLEASSRFPGCLGEGDTIARLSGDEFVVVLEGLSSDGQAEVVAQAMVTDLAAPITIQGQTVVVRASVGVSHYPEDGTTIKELLRHADDALQRAKEGGRNTVCCYSADMSRDSNVRTPELSSY